MKSTLKFVIIIASAAMSLNSVNAEDLKIASIKMENIFNAFYKTQNVQEDIKINQERIQNENTKRLNLIKNLQTEIEKLDKQRSDATISDKKRLEIERKIKLKVSEGNAADSDRRMWLQRQSKNLGEQSAEKQRVIINEIKEKIANYAREQDFDIIIDQSSASITRTPTFAFVKDKFDVTEIILKDLNKDAPKVEEKPTTDK